MGAFYLRLKIFILTICLGSTFLPAEVELPFGKNPNRNEVRNWINNLPGEDREEGIAKFYEQIGKPVLRRTLNQKSYKAPGISHEDTQSFVFKSTDKRDLHVFVDYPADWKAGDKRPALIFWHGGGFTQGNAGQFYYQANYFTQRGAVCFRPEYRIRDLDQTIPTAVVGTIDPDKLSKLDIFVSNFAGLAENANSSDW